MRIFKFGGASVKDAEGVKNVAKVLQTVGYDNTLVIVSAMGKMTNAFEGLVENYFENKSEVKSTLANILDYHTEILNGLFENTSRPIYDNINNLIKALDAFFRVNKSPDYNFVYDQTVSYGELISSSILSAYLNEIGTY